MEEAVVVREVETLVVAVAQAVEKQNRVADLEVVKIRTVHRKRIAIARRNAAAAKNAMVTALLRRSKMVLPNSKCNLKNICFYLNFC